MGLAFLGIWIIFSTIAAPVIIQKAIATGNSAASSLFSGGFSAGRAAATTVRPHLPKAAQPESKGHCCRCAGDRRCGRVIGDIFDGRGRGCRCSVRSRKPITGRMNGGVIKRIKISSKAFRPMIRQVIKPSPGCLIKAVIPALDFLR